MESVCLKCGDIGFPEALVFCNKCEACGLHRYCLDGPVILYDDVTWFCEDCEPNQLVSCEPNQLVPCEPNQLVPCSREQSTLPSSETTDSLTSANIAKEAKGKLKKSINRSKKSKLQQQKKTEAKQKNVSNSGLVAKTKVVLADTRNSPEPKHRQCSISSEQENKSKSESEPVPRDAPNSIGGLKPIQISQVTVNDDINHIEPDCYAQPIADPIWRGDVHVSDEAIGNINGLMAHMSNLACTRVLEESELLPEVLFADLPPRSVVWPPSFMKEGPTDKSIALYFFPENESSEKVFDKVVDDIIRMEVAIRVVTKNAVLLIFPSTLLPTQHKRFQAKYYLWGVFRKKQTSQ